MESATSVTRVRIVDKEFLLGLINDHYSLALYAFMTSIGLTLIIISTIYVRFISISSGKVVNLLGMGKWGQKYANILVDLRGKLDRVLPYLLIAGMLQIDLTFWYLLTHPIATIVS